MTHAQQSLAKRLLATLNLFRDNILAVTFGGAMMAAGSHFIAQNPSIMNGLVAVGGGIFVAGGA